MNLSPGRLRLLKALAVAPGRALPQPQLFTVADLKLNNARESMGPLREAGYVREHRTSTHIIWSLTPTGAQAVGASEPEPEPEAPPRVPSPRTAAPKRESTGVSSRVADLLAAPKEASETYVSMALRLAAVEKEIGDLENERRQILTALVDR